jgi:DNA polymerase elongation subunit (family B)
MSYIKCYATRIGKYDSNLYKINLWDEGGYDSFEWLNTSYIEDPNGEFTGLEGEKLRKTSDYNRKDYGLHYHDMKPHQKFLIEKYGTNDTPSTGHREMFFDIECEIGGALTKEYIENAPMPITSIAWWDKKDDEWAILVWDKKGLIPTTTWDKQRKKKIIPCKTEKELLGKFIEMFITNYPDILIGYNSDYFDIPYLYYRICKVLGKDYAEMLSPTGQIKTEKASWWKHRETGKWVSSWTKRDQFVDIVGIESLDYIRLHKKYSWKDEPSYKLDAIGEKYAGVSKIDYDGNLDQLFETDLHKFIQYNFRDVEILKLLDEKLDYIALTKNLAHKGKHNYSEVYSNSVTQDGAISAYLLSQNIIPPARPYQGKRDLGKKETYAGGYLFCPKAGLYDHMFDLDLVSLYPCIIMSLNIGRETLVGYIKDEDKRNSRLAIDDLKEMDPNKQIEIRNVKGQQTFIKPPKLIKYIKDNELSVSANGAFFKQDKESVLSTILNTWFDERVIYKNKMKDAYKKGNKEEGEYYYLMQYTMKILLNSLYGATALPTFRYGLPDFLISQAITLTGQRIIQESALCANTFLNKVLRDEIKLEI